MWCNELSTCCWSGMLFNVMSKAAQNSKVTALYHCLIETMLGPHGPIDQRYHNMSDVSDIWPGTLCRASELCDDSERPCCGPGCSGTPSCRGVAWQPSC